MRAMTRMSINDTQKSLLDLLIRVADFLEENGITFYLFGGTAIGALRHRGFIPWDDDIDILMDRDNYYRLMEAAGSLPDDLEYDCFELDHGFGKPYGMFCKRTDTATSLSRMYWGGICMGTAIDVFLTDDVPEDRLDEYVKDLFLYQEIMADAWLYKADIVNYKDEYFELMERRRQIGKPALMEELKARLERWSFEESDRRVVRVSGGSPVRKYKKEWIGEPKWCRFEGHRMPLQTRPEACLRMQYGHNWYMIPEPDDQTHHVQIQNYEISYNNYYKDLSCFIDWDEAAEVNIRRKMADVGRLESRAAVQSFQAELRANAVMMSEEPDEDEVCGLYERGEYGAVIDSLDGLTKELKLIIKAGCYRGQLSPSLLNAWIGSLIRAGRYWDAIKVKNAFVDPDSTQRPDDMMGLLDKVTAVAENWQDHLAAECEAALSDIPEELRFQIPDCVVACSWLTEKGRSQWDEDQLISACDRILKDFPCSWDIVKVKADALIRKGMELEGEELYRQVADNSRNGLDLLDIKDYFADKSPERMKAENA